MKQAALIAKIQELTTEAQAVGRQRDRLFFAAKAIAEDSHCVFGTSEQRLMLYQALFHCGWENPSMKINLPLVEGRPGS